MIRFRRVTRIYSAGKGGLPALDDVSFEIPFGEFAVVTGPSGCGKSTLLNLLGGLDSPTSGEIWVGGTWGFIRPGTPNSRDTGATIWELFSSFSTSCPP
jgi:ABC-type antimicrobial peptide transport system, ATPase component